MQYLVHVMTSSSSNWFTDRKSVSPNYSYKKILLNFQGGDIGVLVQKTLSLTLNIYDTPRVEVSKSNFLLYNLVPLYWLTSAENKSNRLVSCFSRNRGVGLTSGAMLGSSCCHSSSSHAAILTCSSLRKKSCSHEFWSLRVQSPWLLIALTFCRLWFWPCHYG